MRLLDPMMDLKRLVVLFEGVVKLKAQLYCSEINIYQHHVLHFYVPDIMEYYYYSVTTRAQLGSNFFLPC